jgi:hypothetical protein
MTRPSPAFGRFPPWPRALYGATVFRRYGRRRGGDARLARLFWLTVLVLGCISLGCIAVGLSSPTGALGSGKNLRADPVTPKLNHTRTEGPHAEAETATPSEPEPSELALHVRSTAEPPVPPAELPRVVEKQPVPAEATAEPPPAELPRVATAPLALIEANADPGFHLPRREPTLGESPMTRTWNTLALAAALAAVTPTQAPAGGTPADKDLKAIVQSLEDLKKAVEALTRKLDVPAPSGGPDLLAEIKRLEKSISGQIDKVNSDLKNETSAIQAEQLKQKLELQNLQGLQNKLKSLDGEVSSLYEEVSKLRKQLLAQPVPTLPVPGTDKAAFDDLRLKLGAIEKALALLQVPTNGKERVSLSPPTGNNLGRVLLVNLYNEDLLFIVNNQPFRVEPGRTVAIDAVPSGALTYQVHSPVWGTVRTKATTLQPNETLTVTAR